MNETGNTTLNSTGFPKADTFELIVVGISLTTVALFGIVANVISLCVFSRPEMKSSVNCCLQGLAMFDIAVLVCAIFLFGLRSLGRSEASFLREYTWKISPFIITFLYPVALVAQTGSIWTTVAVTVERYVAVCHPLKARSFCTYRRARYYNLTVLVFAIAYNVPRCFEVERSNFFDPNTNETYYSVTMSDFRKNKVYFKVYYIGMYLLVMYVIPFAVLSVLNGLIWKTVHSANRDRRLLSRRLQKEFGLAVMLLGVVAIFIFCNVLAPITNILEFFEQDIPYIVYTSNLLVVINSSANLVVYCLFGHRFKRFLLHIFCRKDITELAYYSRDSVRWTSIRLTTPKSSISSGQTNQVAITSISMDTCKIKSRDSFNH